MIYRDRERGELTNGQQKLIREAVHSEYYYKDKSENEKAILVGHTGEYDIFGISPTSDMHHLIDIRILEHCIDILRAGAMCRADTAIFPYHWSDATRLPNPTWVQKHECINWNRLEEWLESRRIDILTPGMLVHPKYGRYFWNPVADGELYCNGS